MGRTSQEDIGEIMHGIYNEFNKLVNEILKDNDIWESYNRYRHNIYMLIDVDRIKTVFDTAVVQCEKLLDKGKTKAAQRIFAGVWAIADHTFNLHIPRTVGPGKVQETGWNGDDSYHFGKKLRRKAAKLVARIHGTVIGEEA